MAKVYWKNFWTALKGQFQGREKYAVICLESVVDASLWFWHAAFETLNDINNWERSASFESMTNRENTKNDLDLIAALLLFDC